MDIIFYLNIFRALEIKLISAIVLKCYNYLISDDWNNLINLDNFPFKNNPLSGRMPLLKTCLTTVHKKMPTGTCTKNYPRLGQ